MTNFSTSRKTAYFENLYKDNPDPWNFETSPYELNKYSATIRALDQRQFRSAFEIGCSIGVLTEMLSAQCEKLLAVDIVDTALAHAKLRCKRQTRVTFDHMYIPSSWPQDKSFDLILFSEVLYFLNHEDVLSAAAQACQSLLPDGIILLVNYTKPIDELLDGNMAAELFLSYATSYFTMIDNQHHEGFRIDLISGFKKPPVSNRI